MSNNCKVAPLPDRAYDGIPVLRPACGLVVAREINRDRIVSALAQDGRDEVPVPGGSTAAMNKRKRGHARALLAHQLLQGWPRRVSVDDALTRRLNPDLA